MNILKFALVLLTATGLGFGVEEAISSDTEEKAYLDENDNYDDFTPGFCHRSDEYFLEHMLERLTEEDQVIAHSKIDELLTKYNISIDELNEDYNERYDFMTEFMEFLDESGIEYHYHDNHHDDYEDEDYGNHMGMHR